MKKTTLLLFLLVPIIIYCQNTHEINFKITDSVVIKKDYPYATKINLEINIPDFQEAFFLYYFDKCVRSYALSEQYILSNPLVVLFDPEMLQYVITDKNHEIIEQQSGSRNFSSYSSVNRKRNRIGTFVNSKQKVIIKELNYKQRLKYNLAKYKINKPKQNVALYLLLSEYHPDLPKGEYYLYLTYFLNPYSVYISKEVATDNRIFKGYIVSNKVKLIVE